jgi:hypothetical protein
VSKHPNSLANLKPFKKGNPGGPGRPPTPKEIRELALNASPEALKVVKAILANKKVKPDTRLKAADMLLDRGVGTAKQSVEVSGPDGGPIKLVSLTDEQLDALEQNLAGLVPVSDALATTTSSTTGTLPPKSDAARPDSEPELQVSDTSAGDDKGV